MAKHRTHSVEFKRQVAQEYLAGETLHGLAKRHDSLAQPDPDLGPEVRGRRARRGRAAADMLQEYEARIAALERLVGKQALELEFLKGALRFGPRPRSAPISVITGPGLSVAEGCRLMGLARSTYYDAPTRAADDTAIVEAMRAISDEFEPMAGAVSRPPCGSRA